MRRLLPLLSAPLLLAACGGTPAQMTEDADVTLAEAGWADEDGQIELRPLNDAASLVDHLRSMGRLAKVTGHPVLQPLFDAKSAEVIADGEFLYVYEFPTPQETQAAQAGVVGEGRMVNGIPTVPEGPVQFFRKDRLIVMYVGFNEDMKARLTEILGQPFART